MDAFNLFALAEEINHKSATIKLEAIKEEPDCGWMKDLLAEIEEDVENLKGELEE